MIRFLVLAVTLVVLAMSGFAFVADHLAPAPGSGIGSGPGVDFGFGTGRMPPRLVLATWLLEAIGLTALFLLVQGRAGTWWLDGLATGWLAWVFRGPLLVLTVSTATRLPSGPWWTMAQRWFLLYTVCGVLVAGLARTLRLRR